MIKKRTCLFAALFFVAYLMVGLFLLEESGVYFNRTIVWNLVLAVLPLGFVMIYLFLRKKNLQVIPRRILGVLCAFAWIILFPNAPYMVTDLIHFELLTFFDYSSTGIHYARNLLNWAELLHTLLGVLVGMCAGYYSLYLLQALVRERFGRGLSWAFVCGVSLISSYGVFIGRFIRLNSWDILSPSFVIQGLTENADHFTVEFTLIFCVFMLLSYGCFYALLTRSDERELLHTTS